MDQEIRSLSRRAGDGDYQAAMELAGRLKPLGEREAEAASAAQAERAKRRALGEAKASQNRRMNLTRVTNAMNLVLSAARSLIEEPVVASDHGLRNQAFQDAVRHIDEARSAMFDAWKVACGGCDGTGAAPPGSWVVGGGCPTCCGSGLQAERGHYR